jgi:hypothetical protein
MNITTSIEVITPQKAMELLAFNTSNRNPSPRHVRILADEMKSGAFKLNGDAIRVGVSGRILDGQHRLMAIIQSGISIETLVIRGLPDGVFDTIDNLCKRRDNVTIFQLKGELHCATLNGAIAFVLRYKTGDMYGNRKLSATAADAALKQYPSIRDSVSISINGAKKIMTPSMLAGLHFLFSEKNEELANVFVDGICDGFDMEKHQNFHMLRERLIANQGGVSRMNTVFMAALSVKAWNYTRANRVTGVLKYSPKNEAFPSIL